jgi:hypothetical protein
MGCKNAVSSAIDYFLNEEDFGIILEDDTVPTIDFFNFVDIMSKRYEQSDKVMMITGTNWFSNKDSLEPYFFSDIFSIWGWATWSRAWNSYDVEMKAWANSDTQFKVKEKYGNKIFRYLKSNFDHVLNDKLDSWAYPWVLTLILNGGLCVTPNVNLVTNIGVNGTHFSGQSKLLNNIPIKYDFNRLKDYTPPIKIDNFYTKKFYSYTIPKTYFIKMHTKKILKKIGLYYKVVKFKNFLLHLKNKKS